ncbi:cis-aconitate decarboxylase isoform X1 [Grus americana]|uniref:cis-aconitate decarboxylase isoform X1 n=2 Tax=Grus americana TaxID=9117 RepID=UPI0024077C30|nr:cis-aconitate decarboxylase isoform X1 [Grus americana]
MWAKTITGNFANVIHGLNANHLTDQVIQRSKRMILDTLGVGLLGTSTEVCHKVTQYSKIYSSDISSTVWGHLDFRLPPLYAAFVNGVAVHSMDFDDTWHPATHPSGTVLPAVIALSEAFPQKKKISGLDLLLAFNVGIEVQGRLLRFSSEARNIPKRFHPPTVVGTMGSAAACAKLLALDQLKCKNALAIAASYAGAPLANAATQTKPLHVGNAAKHGLEAACLASQGLQGNKQILDMESGIGAFYTDYNPQTLPTLQSYPWLLGQQDVAIKRFPAHLGTHWVADAASSVRRKLVESSDNLLPLDKIEKIILKVPEVKYVNRPSPNSEHEARHSFQFVACSALLDGSMSVQSFASENVHRPALRELLCKTQLEHPPDNIPSFESLYCEVSVMLRDGNTISDRCDTFYGHWRKPLKKEDLEKKFQSNASHVLPAEATEGIIETVYNLEKVEDCSVLSTFLSGQSARALLKKLHFL